MWRERQKSKKPWRSRSASSLTSVSFTQIYKLCIRCQPSACPPCFSSCLLGQSQWPGQPMQPSNYADHRRSHGRFPISVWGVQLAWQEGNTQSARSTGNGGHNIWRAKPAYRSVKLLENLLEKCLVHCTFFLHEQIIRHFDWLNMNVWIFIVQ